MTIDEFISLMEKNGFILDKGSPDINGYPVFGFKIDDHNKKESIGRNK
jgi:hypothetical protein